MDYDWRLASAKNNVFLKMFHDIHNHCMRVKNESVLAMDVKISTIDLIP